MPSRRLYLRQLCRVAVGIASAALRSTRSGLIQNRLRRRIGRQPRGFRLFIGV
jgi:hypothetical protein